MGEGTERLEELLGDSLDLLVEEAMAESGSVEGMRDEESQKTAIKEEILTSLQDQRDRVVRGHRILQDRVPTTEIMPMGKILKLAMRGDELLPYNDVLGHSDEFIVDLYRECVLILNDGHLEEAADALLFLLHVEKGCPSIWLAYGGVEEQLERWENALGAHLTASVVDPEDPEPMVSAARCLMNMGHNDKAMDALSLGREIAKGADKQETAEEISGLIAWLKAEGEK